MFKKAENGRFYVTLFNTRFVFFEGKYMGKYKCN